MILRETTIREIVSARHRRRTLTFPVEKGDLGQLRRCPMQEGGVYVLTTGTEYMHKYFQAVGESSSRAQAVLLFIDLVTGEKRTNKRLQVTVTAGPPLRDGNDRFWTVPISLGDVTGLIDRPVFLSRFGDYTLTASQQAVPGDPEVMFPEEGDVVRARELARNRRSGPPSQSVRALREHAESCRGVMQTIKQKNRHKLILKELERLEEETAA